jgi:hypothetical protein
LPLSEKNVTLPIEQAYAELKSLLLKNKCRIIEEKPYNYITVKQGSLNGVLPKSAKKTVKFTLSTEGKETKITSSTTIASDWTNMTIVGNIVASVMAAIFVWMALDIQNYLATAKAGFWGWLAQVYGYPNRAATTYMVNVTLALAVFLVCAVIVEIIIVIYVYPRKESFAEKMLVEL